MKTLAHSATSRRNALSLFILCFLGFTQRGQATPAISKPRKVLWQKLVDEPVGPGDMFAKNDTDPNTPERQGSDRYNLQMQAVHPSDYGNPASKIPHGNGDYWRPIGIVDVES